MSQDEERGERSESVRITLHADILCAHTETMKMKEEFNSSKMRGLMLGLASRQEM